MPDSSNLNRGYGRLGGSFKNWGGTEEDGGVAGRSVHVGRAK